MRFRERKRQENFFAYQYYSWDSSNPYDYNYPIYTEVEEISDENHGKSRPDDSCYHLKAKWRPTHLLDYSPDFDLYDYGPDERHAYHVAALVKSLVSRAIDSKLEDILRKYYDRNIAAFERFDVLNAIAGLADLGAYFKALDKYRYLDWEFGMAPTLADAKEAYSRVFSSIDAVNARIESYSKPQNFSNTSYHNLSLSCDEPIYFLDSSFVTYSGDIRLQFRGKILVEQQKLLPFDRDWFIWLDKVGFHPDIAALWEAIPFSWLIDWFVPIGNSLEGFSGNWFNPTLHFQGTYSYKCLCDVSMRRIPYRYWDPSTWNARNSGADQGSGSAKIYSRSPLGASIDSRSLSSPSIRVPVPDPRKCAILTDVKGINYVDWARRYNGTGFGRR